MQAQPTFVPLTRAEVLESKLAVWQSRLAYAREHDRGYVAECERAITDLKAKAAA